MAMHIINAAVQYQLLAAMRIDWSIDEDNSIKEYDLKIVAMV